MGLLWPSGHYLGDQKAAPMAMKVLAGGGQSLGSDVGQDEVRWSLGMRSSDRSGRGREMGQDEVRR